MKNKFIFVILSFLAINAISSVDKILENISVENGFEVSIFSNTTSAPRQITEGDTGYIFVGSKRGDVYALKDHDDNGKADFSVVVASDMGDSSGVAFYNGSLFIAEIDKVWKIEDIEEKLDRGNSIRDFEKILVTDDLPSDTWHGRKWIKFDQDGSFLVNVGAPCNVCLKDDPRYATIMRFRDSKWSIVARGVRNSVGFDFNPQNNRLYFTDNGRDWLGDSLPSCELNVLLDDGDFFGFPYLHANDVVDPDFGESDHGYEINKPILELGPHVAPTGITFYSGNHFPASYTNNAFITLHGSWNSSKKVGYKVIRVEFDDKGLVNKHSDFMTGFLSGEQVIGRPAAPFEMSDGSLLISDDYSNLIYRVTYKG
jgi:glucose/arabinose dehydrogenase